jgi:23S rRNA (adenine1618-N6)-methyltransferase
MLFFFIDSLAIVYRSSTLQVYTATSIEKITEGGEVDFVKRIIDESLVLKSAIRWYTSMLGKRSSLKTLRSYLHEKAIDNHVATEFIQGRTHRWGIAWSFMETMKKPTKLTYPPDHLEFSTSIPASQVAIEIRQFLITHGIPNEMTTSRSSDTKDDGDFDIDGHVTEDVWSRRARRKKLKLTQEEVSRPSSQSQSLSTAFRFHISIRHPLDGDKRHTIVQMERFSETDSAQSETGHLFLSLHNSIKRHIQAGRQAES